MLWVRWGERLVGKDGDGVVGWGGVERRSKATGFQLIIVKGRACCLTRKYICV